jgi:hypothetical protein
MTSLPLRVNYEVVRLDVNAVAASARTGRPTHSSQANAASTAARAQTRHRVQPVGLTASIFCTDILAQYPRLRGEGARPLSPSLAL